MKKLIVPFIVLFAVGVALVSWRSQSTAKDPAVVINDGFCLLFDGDGALVLAEGSHAVITSNGNGKLTCKAKNVANSTGQAVIYNAENTGLPCGTSLGLTDDWHNTVSASGNSSLQCHN